MDYYYSKNKENFYQKLTGDPLFSLLTDYLYEHREKETILRELKKEFPQNKFSHFLDLLIDAGLIKREERRYHLNFPVFDPNDYLQQATSAAEIIADQLKRLSVAEQKLTMGEVIWAYCFEDERKEAYFYGVRNSPETELLRTTAGNQKYRFITLSSKEHFPLTLANYFFIQKNQLPVTKAFKELAELIGDVNEAYFFDQIEVIVDRIRKNKYKNRRPSIFHQSLLVTNTIKEEESFTLALPIVEKNNLEIEFPTLDPSLTMEEMAFLKRQIFSELSKKFIPHAFSYIKEYRTVLVSKT